ncbi:hypothetical protein M408DRAFT_326227 [Serendipita vermifera MAFF 305830]|uniref:Importin N-terminal domain-containing protein n=1 Tax=Serendipita vermifera MAFF 305830 TaxID=933852 RepID=A0A0C3B9N7_SERVB|nr:hypothetical protein M408DRAFT_326227 [Serendipita vermifera MAFF 305830]
MPTIEVVDDNEEEQEQEFKTLEELLATFEPGLKVPKDFSDPDWAVGNNAATLISWRNRASESIKKLYKAVESSEPFVVDQLYVPLVAAVVSFTGSRDWVKAEARESAQAIMSHVGPPTLAQIRAVLLNIVKPAFEKARPNESLNLNTATKMKRGINADLAYHDEADSVWKHDLRLVDIVSWCLTSLQDNDWESIWPLIIPPVLTYMDDWEAAQRLFGVALTRQLVARAPSSLLTRTGIDQLIRTSLGTSLLRFGDPLSPILFKQAAMASMELAGKTAKVGSPEYYQLLFSLVGENIIGGAWTFGYREPLLIQATYEILPQILENLGVACVRYLKALVPQLLHTLVPLEGARPSVELQKASLRALKDVIHFGAPRISYWSGEIVGGIAKFWVLQEDKQVNDPVITSLLVAVLRELSSACPDVTQARLEVLNTLDPRFSRLISSIA